MTLNEITTLLAEPFDRQFDVPFKLMLAERVKAWRARLIHDTLRKRPSEAKFFVQPIFFKLKKEELIVCGQSMGCDVFTSDPIPEGVRGMSSLAAYVGSVDGKTPFRESPLGASYYLSLGILNVPTYTMSGGILTLDRYVPIVRMDRVFADPEKAMTFGCNVKGDANTCEAWDEQYPMPGDIEQMVIQAISQELRTGTNEQEVTENRPVEK